MKYVKPLNETDANASYKNADPANAQKGSTVPAEAIEYPQREIVNLITSAGLTPSEADLTQAARAVDAKIANATANLVTRGELTNDITTMLLDGLGYTMGGSTPRWLVKTAARKLTIAKDTYVKLDTFGWWKTSAALELDIEALLGSTLDVNSMYYIYLGGAIGEDDEASFSVIVSKNSTYPSGWTAQNTRKIGWFHTLGASVESGLTYTWGGATNAHPYAGLSAGDIDPNSVFCRSFRPSANVPFMNYVEDIDKAVTVFKQSGTGVATSFVSGATITDTRRYANHEEDLACVGLHLPTASEFAIFADGSNQKTAIAGAADPVTTGFWKDTANRSMISRYGLWGCCGALWEFLSNCSGIGSVNWQGINDGKGDTYGAIPVLLGGGNWVNSASCGSRALAGNFSRATCVANYSARGLSRILRGFEYA